jgi:hypothetical protein
MADGTLLPDGRLTKLSSKANTADDEPPVSSFLPRTPPTTPPTKLERLQRALALACRLVVAYLHKNVYKRLPRPLRRLGYKAYRAVARLPIANFYAYMAKADRPLLMATLFVNYGLPLLLEMTPWYLSRRLLSKHLRDTRNAIQHSLLTAGGGTVGGGGGGGIVAGGAGVAAAMRGGIVRSAALTSSTNSTASTPMIGGNRLVSYILMTMVFAAVDTVEQTLRARVSLANRMLVKRMLVGRKGQE